MTLRKPKRSSGQRAIPIGIITRVARSLQSGDISIDVEAVKKFEGWMRKLENGF
jgi:hypothetical protein